MALEIMNNKFREQAKETNLTSDIRHLASKTGFSLVEVLLASSVFALIVTAIVGAIVYSQQYTAVSGTKSRALSIAEEGIEAVRNIRDEDFSNLSNGNHGLALSSNQWTFSGSSDTINNFTRQIQVSSVDANTKKITSTVSWNYLEKSSSVTLTSYLTNWKAATETLDWAYPTEEASLDLSGIQDGLKIDVQNNYAYIVRNGGSPNLASIDITDSASPSLSSSLSLTGAPTNIKVSGNYAYITKSLKTQEMEIIDITNPALPSTIGGFNAGGNKINAQAQGIDIVGSTTYLVRSSSNEDEFYVIDVSTPSSPSEISSLNLSKGGNEIIILSNNAYIASSDNSQELQVIDISNPNSPSLVGSYDLSGTSDALSITGFANTVLLGRADGLLYIFDISTPNSPVLTSSFNAVGSINDLALKNDNSRVFLATSAGSQDFQAIDITTLASPTSIGVLDLDSVAYGVAFHPSKNRVFAANAFDAKEFMVIAP